jgi:phosphate transport system protein
MADAFASQLNEVQDRLLQELATAPVTLYDIASAVVSPSAEGAVALTRKARALRSFSRTIDIDLLALTAAGVPVSEELRLLVALIQLAQRGALIANQFELISEQLTDIDASVSDRGQTAGRLAEMARLAAIQLDHALSAFASLDLESARDIDSQDDAIDRLNRDVFEATLELDAGPDQRELALRHVLIARSLERIGDNAVDIAEQAAFLVTTELQEFTDASTPKLPRARAGDPPGQGPGVTPPRTP